MIVARETLAESVTAPSDRRFLPVLRASPPNRICRIPSRRPICGRGQTAFGNGRSTRLGVESPSSTMHISTPRRFICIGARLESSRLTGLAMSLGSVSASGSFSGMWRLSRPSWTRSMSSPSADAASLLEWRRSIHAWAGLKTDGKRFGSTPEASRASPTAGRSPSTA